MKVYDHILMSFQFNEINNYILMNVQFNER